MAAGRFTPSAIVGDALTLGRFLPPSVAEKYDLDIPPYKDDDQMVETGQTGQRSKAGKVLNMTGAGYAKYKLM